MTWSTCCCSVIFWIIRGICEQTIYFVKQNLFRPKGSLSLQQPRSFLVFFVRDRLWMNFDSTSLGFPSWLRSSLWYLLWCIRLTFWSGKLKERKERFNKLNFSSIYYEVDWLSLTKSVSKRTNRFRRKKARILSCCQESRTVAFPFMIEAWQRGLIITENKPIDYNLTISSSDETGVRLTGIQKLDVQQLDVH